MPRKKLTEEEEIARVKAMYEYEHNCRDNGYTVVAGVDEEAEVRLPVLYTRRRLYFRMTL